PVRVEVLDNAVDSLFEEPLAGGLEFCGVNLAIVVLVQLPQGVVDLLNFGGTILIAIAHLDEDVDEVGRPAPLLQIDGTLLQFLPAELTVLVEIELVKMVP